MYCDPPPCLQQTSQARTSTPLNRHNRWSSGLEEDYGCYNDYGNFFTDCTAPQQQYNDFNDNNHDYISPFTGSEDSSFLDVDFPLFDYCSPLTNECTPPFVALEQIPTGVLASQTPGVPQIGIDVDNSPLTRFFMNPFGADLPGDLPRSALPTSTFGWPTPIGTAPHFHQSSSDLDTSSWCPPNAQGWPPRNGASSMTPTTSSPLLHMGHDSRMAAFFATQLKPGGNASTSVRPTPLSSHTTPSTSSCLSPPTLRPYIPPKSSPAPKTGLRPQSKAKSKPIPNNEQPPNKFQFVDASDRKTIMRLRNTLVSRRHRENKVKRIQELERLLEEKEREVETLKGR